MFAEEKEKEEATASEKGGTCVICLESVQPARATSCTLGCGHCYHRSCIQDAIDHEYKQRRLRVGAPTLPCPVCRHPFIMKEWDNFADARAVLADPKARRLNGITPHGGMPAGWERESFLNEEGLASNLSRSRLRRSETVHQGLNHLTSQNPSRFHPDPRNDFNPR